ncbi:TPA: hypothetical protein PXF07_002310 [Mannheimia haemolytica]|uniref:TMhelix containing protein n=2 Tax=Mannheimia haemolytica TaxID=75985 RepID=A0A249A045_MANHA|nr:hypothetical protein [Mannheimia haemolytica]YP_009203432.1 hypothetical protein AVV64_gp62 [Mannheimia phage vB_MhS_535AP2]YP_009213825.1 hypothetical protein AVV62_gp62 [Mannheimia phage vB_MhS_1152AP2]AJA73434.1 hypothetical protein 3927AP1_70 [Mannheimia phage vB_MhS_3927AP1]AWW71554.1 hypothetical protein C4O86_07060 [Pasteurellaceae bacterium 12565]AGI32739.1 hypothetical protein D650_14700 [Mannheimia haemolytica USDA-ARS-USMARC-183]AGK02230.1 hypothetical protein MHH_c17810 [Mannhe
MTKFFETIAFVMLFGIIPSCLLAINTTLMNMNIKNAPWFMVIIQLGFNITCYWLWFISVMRNVI